MRVMSSVRFRPISARRFLFCATSLLASLVLSVAADGRTPFGAAPAGPHAAPNAAAPMRFVKVRSDNAACRPDCPEWISAEGKIVTGSAEALERTLNTIGGRRLPIVINSAGGAVEDAMAMGRLIRARRLAVVVAHTTLSPCAKGANTCGEAKGAVDSRGAYCASACTLALAGGVERYVSLQSYIGVHQMTEVIKETQVKKLYKVRYLKFAGIKLELSRHFVGEQKSTTTAKLAADDSVDYDVADYFAEMGVTDPVMKLTMTTPSKSIHWMSADELRLSHLATAWVDRPNPILADAQPNGLAGLAIDVRSRSASQFAATASAPLAEPVNGHRATLEATFAYRRGGATMTTTLSVRDADTGAVLDLPGAGAYLILYPQGAQFRTGRLSAEAPGRLAASLRSFCKLKRGGGSAMVSFVADAAAPDAPHPAPVELRPLTADGGAALFEEACPPRPIAARASVEAEFGDVERVEFEAVAVRLIAFGRTGAEIADRASVVRALDRACRREGRLRIPGARGNRRRARGNIEHRPVPETGAGRRVGIEQAHREALGACRRAGPDERRRTIAAGATEAIANLRVADARAGCEVGARQRQWRGVRRGYPEDERDA